MGAGKHGGFGNTKGNQNSDNKSSIEKNAEAMKNEYPHTASGFFGKKGKNSRIIECENPIGTSIDFLKKIGKGGKVSRLPKGKGTRIDFDDGTVIIHRIITKTPNSPAVDINISNPSSLKPQKIHFIKGK